jgi:hypothetical protein
VLCFRASKGKEERERGGGSSNRIRTNKGGVRRVRQSGEKGGWTRQGGIARGHWNGAYFFSIKQIVLVMRGVDGGDGGLVQRSYKVAMISFLLIILLFKLTLSFA